MTYFFLAICSFVLYDFLKFKSIRSFPIKIWDVDKNNCPGWRRILVRIQGAMKRAYRDMWVLSQQRIRAKRHERWDNYFFSRPYGKAVPVSQESDASQRIFCWWIFRWCFIKPFLLKITRKNIPPALTNCAGRNSAVNATKTFIPWQSMSSTAACSNGRKARQPTILNLGLRTAFDAL